ADHAAHSAGMAGPRPSGPIPDRGHPAHAARAGRDAGQRPARLRHLRPRPPGPYPSRHWAAGAHLGRRPDPCVDAIRHQRAALFRAAADPPRMSRIAFLAPGPLAPPDLVATAPRARELLPWPLPALDLLVHHAPRCGPSLA